ncbi:hypothetical protein [Tepidibacter mesophilus]|nr:hypothetical protein [Tepidibacter mesophilus]
MDAIQVVLERKSIRKYEEREVSDEIVKAISNRYNKSKVHFYKW